MENLKANKVMVANSVKTDSKVECVPGIDLTDEGRFALISNDPFFKRKAREAEELLSKLDSDQDW